MKYWYCWHIQKCHCSCWRMHFKSELENGESSSQTNDLWRMEVGKLGWLIFSILFDLVLIVHWLEYLEIYLDFGVCYCIILKF